MIEVLSVDKFWSIDGELIKQEAFKLFGNVILVMLTVFFWKYMWVKKCVKMRVMLFKNWKHVFKHVPNSPFITTTMCDKLSQA